MITFAWDYDFHFSPLVGPHKTRRVFFRILKGVKREKSFNCFIDLQAVNKLETISETVNANHEMLLEILLALPY